MTKRTPDEIIYYWSDQGLSIKEVARKLNISHACASAVIQHGRAYGFCKPFTKEQRIRSASQAWKERKERLKASPPPIDIPNVILG